MKQILLAVFLSWALIACNKSEQEKADGANSNGNSVTQVEIKVPTIQCNSCVAHVEAALKEVEGVSATKINLESKIAQVSFDPAMTNLAAMEKAITMAGYDANEAKSDSVAYAELDACCKIPESHGGK